jgi:cytochrome b involved in lipid metabolism
MPTQVTPSEEPKPKSPSPEEEATIAPNDAKPISWSEVEKNSAMESCWIVLRDIVYDFTFVVQQHPLGAQLSNVVCGKDATKTFETNANVDEVILQLKPYYLGPVE